MSKFQKVLFSVASLLVILVSVATLIRNDARQVQGSVVQSSEYQSTTTYVGFTNRPVLITGPGTLGSVIITGTTTGQMYLYDATTTNVNLRTGNLSTTTITIASFMPGEPVGVYTFDTRFQNGLLLDWQSPIGTTTITFRP